MKRSANAFFVSLILLSLLALDLYSKQAQSQHPVLDMVANRVIQKYQGATCEQLWQERANKKPPSEQEKDAIQMLKGDPQLRSEFLGKVAAPVANKMFECGMIP
jgi:hypothetical protein